MAIWQLMRAGQPTGESFDDLQPQLPGDEDFSTEAVQAEVTAQEADGFNYVGPSAPPGE